MDIRRDTSRFGLCRVGAPPCRSDTDRQQMKNPLKRCFKGFCLILSSKLLDFERKTRLEPAFAGISRELFLHPLTPGQGVLWGRSWRVSFSAPSEASLIKGRFGGIVYMVADSSAKRTKKAIIFRLSLCVERKTRLELATPTLARLCSTN